MTDAITSEVAEHYNRSVDDPLSSALREGSLFFNYGYWHDGATCMREASERLMDELIARTDMAAGAMVLDAACGMGATTAYIALNTDAARVIGINISDKQLDVCRENAPDLDFFNMSATQMTFEDNSFDTVFCVEAAFHFNTRRDFLTECHRILKPGGRIALTDIPVVAASPDHVPENRIESMDAYCDLLADTGFQPVSFIDRSRECIGGYVPFVRFFRDTMMQRGQISRQHYLWLTWRANMLAQNTYLEIVADAV